VVCGRSDGAAPPCLELYLILIFKFLLSSGLKDVRVAAFFCCLPLEGSKWL
jgi:hypothetical protein